MAVQSCSEKWYDKCVGARERYHGSYFHLAFLFLPSPYYLTGYLTCCQATCDNSANRRETEGANNNDQPSLNRWHASLGGWLKCYFHFSFPNYLSNYFKFSRLSSSYEFSLTIDLSRITLQWANIKKWGRGSGGQFHTNHYILSTRASSWCLCLQECGKGLLAL